MIRISSFLGVALLSSDVELWSGGGRNRCHRRYGQRLGHRLGVVDIVVGRCWGVGAAVVGDAPRRSSQQRHFPKPKVPTAFLRYSSVNRFRERSSKTKF